MLMTIAGTPFQPGFTPPALNGVTPLTGPVFIGVENPRFGLGVNSANDLDVVLFFSDGTPPPGVQQGPVFETLVNRFAAGSLDDDACGFVLNFTDDFGAVHSVIVLLQVRTPLRGTDGFTEAIHRGRDGVMALISRARAEPPGPSRGGAGGDPDEGSHTPRSIRHPRGDAGR